MFATTSKSDFCDAPRCQSPPGHKGSLWTFILNCSQGRRASQVLLRLMLPPNFHPKNVSTRRQLLDLGQIAKVNTSIPGPILVCRKDTVWGFGVRIDLKRDVNNSMFLIKKDHAGKARKLALEKGSSWFKPKCWWSYKKWLSKFQWQSPFLGSFLPFNRMSWTASSSPASSPPAPPAAAPPPGTSTSSTTIRVTIIHHPSSIIHHPSSIIHHPSSIIHHPSSIIIIIIIISYHHILSYHFIEKQPSEQLFSSRLSCIKVPLDINAWLFFVLWTLEADSPTLAKLQQKNRCFFIGTYMGVSSNGGFTQQTHGLSYLKWSFWGVLEVSPFKETSIYLLGFWNFRLLILATTSNISILLEYHHKKQLGE